MLGVHAISPAINARSDSEYPSGRGNRKKAFLPSLSSRAEDQCKEAIEELKSKKFVDAARDIVELLGENPDLFWQHCPDDMNAALHMLTGVLTEQRRCGATRSDRTPGAAGPDGRTPGAPIRNLTQMDHIEACSSPIAARNLNGGDDDEPGQPVGGGGSTAVTTSGETCPWCEDAPTRPPPGTLQSCWALSYHCTNADDQWLSNVGRLSDIENSISRLNNDGGLYQGLYSANTNDGWEGLTGKQKRLVTYHAIFRCIWLDVEWDGRQLLPACVVNEVLGVFPNTVEDWDIIEQVTGLVHRAQQVEWEGARREGQLPNWNY